MSNFWRSLEIPLINSKHELELTWGEKGILASAGTAATFKITDTMLYVPVVTLLTEDNIKLSKQLGYEFKHSVYWNKYKMIPNEKEDFKDGVSSIRKLQDSNFQGFKKLFVLAYD